MGIPRVSRILTVSVVLASLAGCSVGDNAPSIATSPESEAVLEPSATCDPPPVPVGEMWVYVDELAGVDVQLIAGECADTRVDNPMLTADETRLGADVCDTMGIGVEIFEALGGRAIRYVHRLALDDRDDLVAQGCRYNLPPEVMLQVEDRALTWSLLGVVFDYVAAEGKASPDFADSTWDLFLRAVGGTPTAIDDVGVRAVVIDQMESKHTFSVVAQGDDGQIVRLTSWYTPSRRDEQLRVNERLIDWVDEALAVAASLQG